MMKKFLSRKAREKIANYLIGIAYRIAPMYEFCDNSIAAQQSVQADGGNAEHMKSKSKAMKARKSRRR